MKYTINILEESKANFIMELLSSFDYIQIEPKAENDESDWWDGLTAKQQKELKKKLDSIDNGTAETVSDEHVRSRVKQLLDSKKEQK
jgi:hypothetical protein